MKKKAKKKRKKKDTFAARKKLGDRVKEIREYKDLTQLQVAQEADCTFEYVSQVERYLKDAQYSSVENLRKGLGVTGVEFEDDENYPPKEWREKRNQKK